MFTLGLKLEEKMECSKGTWLNNEERSIVASARSGRRGPGQRACISFQSQKATQMFEVRIYAKAEDSGEVIDSKRSQVLGLEQRIAEVGQSDHVI